MRLFIAITLTPQVKEQLRAAQNNAAGILNGDAAKGIKWLHDDQLHLTLKFLGEVSDKKLPVVEDALAESVQRKTSFKMLIAGTGCFPPRGSVRIIWAGVKDQESGVEKCFRAVEGEFAKIGFPPEERDFSPHITLARVKTDSSHGALRDVVSKAELVPSAQQVEKITLYKSVLGSSGAQYFVVKEVSLIQPL
jgi:RNA 2',3'-cyclic 3'-phosphodiesterase